MNYTLLFREHNSYPSNVILYNTAALQQICKKQRETFLQNAFSTHTSCNSIEPESDTFIEESIERHGVFVSISFLILCMYRCNCVTSCNSIEPESDTERRGVFISTSFSNKLQSMDPLYVQLKGQELYFGVPVVPGFRFE